MTISLDLVRGRISHLVPNLLHGLVLRVRVVKDYQLRTHLSGSDCVVPDGDDEHVCLSGLRNPCGACVTVETFSKAEPDHGRFLAALHDLSQSVFFFEDFACAPTQQLADMRDTLTTQLVALVTAAPAIALTTEDADRVAHLVGNAKQTIESLKTALRGGRDGVLANIRTEVLGDDRVDGPVDDTPTLVGIHPYEEGTWGSATAAVAEWCRVNEDPLVLVVPRFVADWLSMQGSAWDNGLHLTANAANLTAEQIETTARLWDPDGRGPLSTLAGAVIAARRV